jgi:hypothetical protein
MSIDRAVERSAAVRVATSLRDGLAERLASLTRRLQPVDRALTRFVRGSFCYRWLTTEPDTEPIVIDLRETYTVGPILDILTRIANVLESAGIDRRADGILDRLQSAPARAVGIVLCLAFGASMLSTIVAGTLTWPVYLFYALGLLVGLAGVRDHRDWETLRETWLWGTLAALFPPPPADGDRNDR